MVTLACAVCNKAFEVQPSRAAHGRGKHCSPACQYESRRRMPKARVGRVCIGCGTAFEIEPGKLAGSQVGIGKYCNRACRDKNRAGTLHPQYLGTRENKPDYGTNWQAQRRKARARDGRCVRCGKTGCPLPVHHKIPIRLWADKEAANDLDNLVTLCHSCHRTVEAASTWLPVDGGVLHMATGGYCHQLAKERGVLKRAEYNEEEERFNLEQDVIEALIMRESSLEPGLRDWATVRARMDDIHKNGLRIHQADDGPSLRSADPPKQASLFSFESDRAPTTSAQGETT